MLMNQAVLVFVHSRPCLPLTCPPGMHGFVHPTQGGRLFVGGDVPDLAQGTAVVFPSYMPHRVEPVRKGSREAMIAFFEGTSGRLLHSLLWRPQNQLY